MNERHKRVFFEVAQNFSCWIGLREPNPLADKWIGRAGYIAKPMSCKAKTADNPAHPFGGLVINPLLSPEAFTPRTLEDARETWTKKFLVNGAIPSPYKCVESGNEKGLVKLNGAGIHPDYDLMAITKSNALGEFLFTNQVEQQKLFDAILPALNRGFGAELVQHGAEFMWDKGVGARASEFVLWFGPGNRFKQTTSSMSTKFPH